MPNRPTIASALAKFYLRQGRGASLIAFAIDAAKMVVYGGAFTYLIKQWFGITIGGDWVVSLAIAYVVITYLLGWCDEKFGFWKRQNEYSAIELTPAIKEMVEKVKSL